MKQEKIEYLIKKLHLKYSTSVVLTAASIYFWVTSVDSNFLDIVGVIINISGLIIWWLAKITLAKNWGFGFGKPTIKKLVTHGIYSKIRHPMYWGVNLTLLGLIILYPRTWFVVLCSFIILYFTYRMTVEDTYLLKNLGKEYQDYKEKTWI